MIHRGLYGRDRLALDILCCDPEPTLVKYVKDDWLPSQTVIKTLVCASAFENTLALKNSAQNKP